MERHRPSARAGGARRDPRHRRPALQGDRTLDRVDGLDRVNRGRSAIAVAFVAFAIGLPGYYWDVSWHADLGRDRTLFTVPHTMVVVTLGLLLAAAISGASTKRVPRSLVALGALAAASLAAFPLDQVWHATFGPDILLWTPSHLLLVLGPSLAPLALWLIARDNGFTSPLLGFALASMTLAGLSAVQAEFDVGVVTRPLIYQPVLIAIAGGFALVVARIMLGPGGAIRACLGALVTRLVVGWAIGIAFDRSVPHPPLYLGAALAIEGVAYFAGTGARLRFGLLAGLAASTVGLAGEWAWTAATARHAWGPALIPATLLLVVPAGTGAAVLGSAFAASLRGERFVRRAPVAIASAAIALGLLIPFPTQGADVIARVTVERAGDDLAVHATLTPANAADDAHWFEVLSWRGGRVVIARMKEELDGTFASDGLVPSTGVNLLRLHRGRRMLAIALPPVARSATFTQRFVKDTAFFVAPNANAVAVSWIVGLLVIALASAAVAALVSSAGQRKSLLTWRA